MNNSTPARTYTDEDLDNWLVTGRLIATGPVEDEVIECPEYEEAA